MQAATEELNALNFDAEQLNDERGAAEFHGSTIASAWGAADPPLEPFPAISKET